MQRSFFIVLCISLLMLFLSGCSSSTQGPVQTDVIGGFMGGPEGLRIRLLEGTPPPVIQDAGLTPFSFIISLENVGETAVGPGTDNPLVLARLGGVVLSDFNLIYDGTGADGVKRAIGDKSPLPEVAVKRLTEKLEPAAKNYDGTMIPGEMNYVSFDNLAYTRNIADSYALTIRAEVCYDYETQTTVKFCVKKDVLEMPEDASICVLRGPKPFGNSGAPVQITKVEEAPVNEKTMQLNFNIEHVGKGIFFFRNEPKDLYDACVFNDMNPNIYKLEVFVEPMQKDTYDVDCQRLETKISGGGESGVIRMYQGAPLSLSCFVTRLKPIETRVYEDMMNIRLVYRYGEFIEQPILVQGHI